MKRLYVFSIRSFIGPFIVTLFISMFILVMQFFWIYIDDLMGKGLSVWVILELLFYVSASLIPLALPLAILLSSIMTFGNLSENNELTALKSSGLSLYRILKPLTVVVFCIALFTFYFANYIIPISNLKWHSLIFDIQNTKIASILTPGSYNQDLDGYAIKIKSIQNDKFQDIIIHDHTDQNALKTIRAKKGRVYKSVNNKYLYFELKDGFMSEEMATQTPNFDENGKLVSSGNNNHPSRRTNFETATYKIDLSGFSMNRSRDDMFKNEHEMLNVFQINYAIDSLLKEKKEANVNFVTGSILDLMYFQKALISDSAKTNSKSIVHFNELSQIEKQNAIVGAQSRLRRKNETLQSQINYNQAVDYNNNKYWIEFHRKFALTYAIIVLFFIGAPLGAIVRKGGFGAPVVIAALLFMVYFVLISIGDSLANSGVVSPFIGMWFASFLLTPIAWFVLRAAANDAPVFNKESWVKLFSRLRKK